MYFSLSFSHMLLEPGAGCALGREVIRRTTASALETLRPAEIAVLLPQEGAQIFLEMLPDQRKPGQFPG
jgi:hypothetical protein